LTLVVLLGSCDFRRAKSTRRGNTAIIPVPLKLNKMNGYFFLDKTAKISVPNNSEEWLYVSNFLNQKIQSSTGSVLETKVTSKNDDSSIQLSIDSTIQKSEGYLLSVTSDLISIKAAFGRDGAVPLKFNIPQVVVSDHPRFPYRGMHLDVSRHFFSVKDVKRYIDLMAMHKLNTFHWHLTDDQGWRVEIKKYPKLTAIGGFRNETLVGHYNDQPHQYDGKRYGGFYTQDEIKEVVQYAAERFITVLPEIELPGHAQAAIAAYPELGCGTTNLDVMQKWGISENVYCPTEETFTFLENVLDEVIQMFPSKYIHIGGDECPKTQWKESSFCQLLMKEKNLDNELELQSYFIRRIEKYLNSKGRNIIGWDEILEGGLAPNASVMSWRGVQGGILAAREGHEVVMTPTSHCYFDYYQSQHKEEPLAIGGFLPIDRVYEYEPIPSELTEEQGQYIKGLQCNLWTEYIDSRNKLDYMAYPRACAIAEIGWSAKSKKNFPDFINRLTAHLKRLEHYGVQYSENLFDIDGDLTPKNGELQAVLKSNLPDTEIFYTLDGSPPTRNSNLYDLPFLIKESSQLHAIGFQVGQQKGRSFEKAVNYHKATGKKITLRNKPAEQFSAGGEAAVINGINGSNERYGDKEWLGFSGEDFIATIDFEKKTEINSIQFRFFKGEGQWIYLPKRIIIFTSSDGNSYNEVAQKEDITTDTKIASPILEINKSARFLKIEIDKYGEIPQGQQGGGHQAWLFVDELIVN